MMALRQNHWKGSPPPPLGHDPQGKILGILGMGGIGRNLMKKAAAFGMVTQYCNRTKLSEELSGGAKYVSFEELLKTSDVLSLNLPLNVSPLLHFQRQNTMSNPSYESVVWVYRENSNGADDITIETNPPHHLNSTVRHDEVRRHNRQHCSRRCHG